MVYLIEGQEEKKISYLEIKRLQAALKIAELEAIEAFLVNEEIIIQDNTGAMEDAQQKVALTVRKELVRKIARFLSEFSEDVEIVNEKRVITFKIDNQAFKLDLVYQNKKQ